MMVEVGKSHLITHQPKILKDTNLKKTNSLLSRNNGSLNHLNNLVKNKSNGSLKRLKTLKFRRRKLSSRCQKTKTRYSTLTPMNSNHFNANKRLKRNMTNNMVQSSRSKITTLIGSSLSQVYEETELTKVEETGQGKMTSFSKHVYGTKKLSRIFLRRFWTQRSKT